MNLKTDYGFKYHFFLFMLCSFTLGVLQNPTTIIFKLISYYPAESIPFVLTKHIDKIYRKASEFIQEEG